MSTPPDPLAIAALQQAVNPQSPDLGQPQTATPVLAGSPGSAEANSNATRPGRPLLLDFMQKMIKPPMTAPAPGQMARPASRLDTFENFLGNFLNAFGQGMSQSGQRGANFKGFGAAIAAPRATNVANQTIENQTQLAQGEAANQQAEAGLKQAQAGLIGQSVPITLPNGQQVYVPASQLGHVAGAQFGAAGRVGAAEAAGKARITAEQVKLMAAQGMISKLVPSTDDNGNFVMKALNKFGQPIGNVDGALPPASYLPTATTEWKQSNDGSWVAMPKTTSKVIPGLNQGVNQGLNPHPLQGLPGQTPSGFPKAAGGGSKKVFGSSGTDMVIGSVGGKEVAVPRSEMGNYKWDSGMSPTKAGAAETEKITNARVLMPQFDKAMSLVDQLNQSGQIGAFISRWNNLSRKAGVGDPRFTALMTQMGINETGLMQVHVGARGSSQLLEHFHDLANAGQLNYANIMAALRQEKSYIQDKAMLPGSVTSPAKGSLSPAGQAYLNSVLGR